MGGTDRLERSRRARENAGKPLGFEGEGAAVVPLPGRADLADLAIEKPIERAGRRGLLVKFRLHTEALAGARLVVETSLHGQVTGPLRAASPAFSDAEGRVGSYEVYRPAAGEAESAWREAFFPYDCIEVAVPGTLKCFARIRVIEENRGQLAEAEVAFELVAG